MAPLWSTRRDAGGWFFLSRDECAVCARCSATDSQLATLYRLSSCVSAAPRRRHAVLTGFTPRRTPMRRKWWEDCRSEISRLIRRRAWWISQRRDWTRAMWRRRLFVTCKVSWPLNWTCRNETLSATSRLLYISSSILLLFLSSSLSPVLLSRALSHVIPSPLWVFFSPLILTLLLLYLDQIVSLTWSTR